MTPPLTGHCLCGATRYAVTFLPLWAAHCHCESCRHATASAFTSFFGIADGGWRWTGAIPATYESSSEVRRDFCATCGSQMTYRSEKFPNETHFYAATLTDPTVYAATEHVHSAEMLPWLHLADGLPRR